MVKKSILFLSVFSLLSLTLISCGKKTETTSGSGTVNPPVNPPINPPVTKVLSISLGQDYLCGIQQDGVALCLGNNKYGQLGNGTIKDLQTSALPVSGDTNFTQISSGFGNTCGLDDKGSAWCWGDNTFGQLGNGTNVSSNVPVKIPSLTGFTQIHTAYSVADDVGDTTATTCGITNSFVYCWGVNGVGQLGNGTTDNSNIPVPVSTSININNFTQVTVGAESACALRSNGEIWCWGGNSYGELGDGTHGAENNSLIPVKVQQNTNDFVSLSSDFDSALHCAIKRDGSAWCWGVNVAGQLGNGTSGPGKYSSVPVLVILPSGSNLTFKQISTAGNHACGLVSDGNIWCWGGNEAGQLGSGTTIDSNIPIKVTNSSDFIQVSVSQQQSCALTKDGKVYCWGIIFGTYDNFNTTPQLISFSLESNSKSKKVEK